MQDAKQIGLVPRESRIAAFANYCLWEVAVRLAATPVVFRTLLPKCLGQERLARYVVKIGLDGRDHSATMDAPRLLAFVAVVLNKEHATNHERDRRP